MRQLFMTILVLTTACTDDGDGGSTAPTGAFPPTGSYASAYRVPTTDPALASAAVYPVDHVDWTVTGDVLTLHYDLPLGLVGGKLDVTFTGTFDGTDTIAIAGANGTGSCTVTGARVACNEVFVALGTLPIDMAVVEQRAVAEYPGPVADRRQLATVFGSDPIGIVEIDSTMPVVDDKGGSNK
jgi:hypothetical protein